MEAIGYEDYFFGDGVCIIEWPEMVDDLLPDTVTAVSIFKDPSKGTDYRRITVE